jgi:hypothetical protein
MVTVLTVSVVVVTVAALAAPHRWLRERWQDSLACLLYKEAKRQLEAAQAEPAKLPTAGDNPAK